MSLITTCPACGTAFHVELAQLAVHRGDVACGKCGHVFNALERLTEIEPEIPAPAAAPEIAAAPPAAPEPPPVTLPAEEAVAQIELPPPAPVPLTPPAPAAMEEPAALPVHLPPPAEAAMPVGRSLEEPAAPHGEAAAQRPHRPAARWWLPPLALLLLLAAAAQGAYFLRSDLAVWLPQLRPSLVQACAALGCRIELPRKVQLLSIDDSDLRRDEAHDNAYVLTATLSNRARHAQAYPLLELTLTDLDDQPVLRRTLAPREYLPAATDIAGGFAAGDELHVKLTFVLDGIAATGYRVYVTYP